MKNDLKKKKINFNLKELPNFCRIKFFFNLKFFKFSL
jgi:hypothetical protein